VAAVSQEVHECGAHAAWYGPAALVCMQVQLVC